MNIKCNIRDSASMIMEESQCEGTATSKNPRTCFHRQCKTARPLSTSFYYRKNYPFPPEAVLGEFPLVREEFEEYGGLYDRYLEEPVPFAICGKHGPTSIPFQWVLMILTREADTSEVMDLLEKLDDTEKTIIDNSRDVAQPPSQNLEIVTQKLREFLNSSGLSQDTLSRYVI